MKIRNPFNKGDSIPVGPPISEGPNIEAESEENEAIEELTPNEVQEVEPKEIKQIAKQVASSQRVKEPIEIAGTKEDEEVDLLTILENFEVRLRKIEYNLRLIP